MLEREWREKLVKELIKSKRCLTSARTIDLLSLPSGAKEEIGTEKIKKNQTECLQLYLRQTLKSITGSSCEAEAAKQKIRPQFSPCLRHLIVRGIGMLHVRLGSPSSAA